jgi:hypothetical protein
MILDNICSGIVPGASFFVYSMEEKPQNVLPQNNEKNATIAHSSQKFKILKSDAKINDFFDEAIGKYHKETGIIMGTYATIKAHVKKESSNWIIIFVKILEAFFRMVLCATMNSHFIYSYYCALPAVSEEGKEIKVYNSKFIKGAAMIYEILFLLFFIIIIVGYAKYLKKLTKPLVILMPVCIFLMFYKIITHILIIIQLRKVAYYNTNNSPGVYMDKYERVFHSFCYWFGPAVFIFAIVLIFLAMKQIKQTKSSNAFRPAVPMVKKPLQI